MAKAELLRLHDLADRKGHDVMKSTMDNHIRLVDADGNHVKNANGGAAFSYAEGAAGTWKGCRRGGVGPLALNEDRLL